MKTTFTIILLLITLTVISQDNSYSDTSFNKSVIIQGNEVYDNIGVEMKNDQCDWWNSVASGGNGNLTIATNWLGRGMPSVSSLPSYGIRMKPANDKFEIRRSPRNHIWMNQLLFKIDSSDAYMYTNLIIDKNISANETTFNQMILSGYLLKEISDTLCIIKGVDTLRLHPSR